MSKKNNVEVKDVKDNVVETETTEGLFTKIGRKADGGVRFVKKHWKPFAGGAAALLVGGAGALAYSKFNGDDDLNLNDNVDLLDSLKDEDPLA